MINTPILLDVPTVMAAVLRVTIRREDISNVIGPGISEVMTAIAAQGIAPAGAWFTRHYQVGEIMDFEIGVPANTPITAIGRVTAGQLPAARIARTTYHGGYEGLVVAWQEFAEWIKANGFTPQSELWECYELGPESGTDPGSWRTQLNWPLSIEQVYHIGAGSAASAARWSPIPMCV